MRLPMIVRLNMSRKRLSVPNGYDADGAWSRGRPTLAAGYGARTLAKTATAMSTIHTIAATAPTGRRRAAYPSELSHVARARAAVGRFGREVGLVAIAPAIIRT